MDTNSSAPSRFAAPAPVDLDDVLRDENTDALEETGLDADINLLCMQWASWCQTRRLYGPSPVLKSVLGRMYRPKGDALCGASPDAICSARLSAFHLAYTCQPDRTDKRAFDLYYVHAVKPVKLAASSLGIGRSQFYKLISEFRRRVFNSSISIINSRQTLLPFK